MYDAAAKRKLKNINKKLCGKYMTAAELAAMMTGLGIKKEDAIHYAEAGRDKTNNVKLEGTEKQKNTAARRMLDEAVNQNLHKRNSNLSAGR